MQVLIVMTKKFDLKRGTSHVNTLGQMNSGEGNNRFIAAFITEMSSCANSSGAMICMETTG